jgi:alpha-D-ribose 1-methylphosphonate 5-triphosphate synthase subunit PhnG
VERRRRTEILIRGNRQISIDLAKEITAKYDVKIIEDPNYGSVMIKARETAKNSLFYFGEMFVTECKVEINGAIGLGILKGNQPEFAYDLAVIDASFNASLPETEQWISILLEEEKGIEQQTEDEFQQILKTKVNFETMDI